jgi:hypothetical protein
LLCVFCAREETKFHFARHRINTLGNGAARNLGAEDAVICITNGPTHLLFLHTPQIYVVRYALLANMHQKNTGKQMNLCSFPLVPGVMSFVAHLIFCFFFLRLKIYVFKEIFSRRIIS